LDVADFIEERQTQMFADARDSLEQSVVASGGGLGELLKLCFEEGDLGVVMADQSQIVLQRELADGVVFLRQQPFFPGIAVGAGLAERRTVVGQLMGLDAGQQFAAAPDVEDPLTQQCPQGTFLRRIDVGRWDEIGAQQVRDLFGINAVVFIFAAVNGLEIEGVGQDEVNLSVLARIRQPVPAEHAFGADGQVVAIRLGELEEVSEVIVPDVGVDELFPVPIHDADVHLAGMEVDSAVELGGGCVIFHNDHSMWGRETPV